MIRVLIVDDERPARDRLRRLLAAQEDVTVVGEAADGPGALVASRALQPDLLLLDIDLPGCRGTEVAASLPSPGPRVVFVTAWDHFAVEAFELQALDYLLKPVTQERLATALQRVRDSGAPGPASKLPAPQRLLVRVGESYRAIDEAEIVCITSEDKLTRLFTAGRDYYLDPSLNDLESRLDATRFTRVSRGAIVRIEAVMELSGPASGAAVVLRDGRRFEVSRRRYPALLAALGKR
jgi:two-component system LytT family response regulator